MALNPLMEAAGGAGDPGGYSSNPSPASVMSAQQAAEHELRALGLGSKATAIEVAHAMQRDFPGGLNPGLVNDRTGLPYTSQTAKAAGYGLIEGSVHALVAYGAPAVMGGLIS
jgi:hypothetical protein